MEFETIKLHKNFKKFYENDGGKFLTSFIYYVREGKLSGTRWCNMRVVK
jgi:hypothetical protein